MKVALNSKTGLFYDGTNFSGKTILDAFHLEKAVTKENIGIIWDGPIEIINLDKDIHVVKIHEVYAKDNKTANTYEVKEGNKTYWLHDPTFWDNARSVTQLSCVSTDCNDVKRGREVKSQQVWLKVRLAIEKSGFTPAMGKVHSEGIER